MTTNTPSQTPIFDQEEFDKMVKDGTKIWAGVDISRDARQAASIDTYGDPRFEELSTALYRIGFHQAGSGDAEAKALADYIDAKLAQAGDDWRDRANVLEARLGEVMEKRDEWKARATAAESRLAEIQRGVEGLTRRDEHHAMAGTYMRVEEKGDYVYFDDVLALLQPQGQADTSGLPG